MFQFENDKIFNNSLKKYYELNNSYECNEEAVIVATNNYTKDILNDGKIHFYLPGFFYHFDLNMELLRLMKEHPEWFYDNIEVGALYDTFPFSIWSGGRCDPQALNCFVNPAQMRYIINNVNAMGVPIRYVYTNSCLTEQHVYDSYCNLTMEMADTPNGWNEVLVNSPILEQYIRETYPNFKIIKSTTACERDINKFNESLENYHMAVMDYRDNKHKEFIDSISHKNRHKVEILVNELCSADCPVRAEHYRSISMSNLAFIDTSLECRFTHSSPFGIDDLIVNNPTTVISCVELYTRYVKMGFRNFKLEGRRSNTALVIDSYVHYLVKQEYADRVKTYLSALLLRTKKEFREPII